MDSSNTDESQTIEARPKPEATSTKFHWYFSAVSPISEVVFVFGLILFALGYSIDFSIEPDWGLGWLVVTSGALGCRLLSYRLRFKLAAAVLLILILHNPISELLR